MNQMLMLASDFLERLSNPAYGLRINEEYSLRFAQLLSSDQFPDLLLDDLQSVDDPNALSPHGWFWLLGWTRSKGITLKDSLLLHLTDTWSSVFMQVAAIDHATRHVKWVHGDFVPSVEEFENSFLRKLMMNCTYWGDVKEHQEPRHVQKTRAESLLVALMQVGTDITLDAASALLNHRWRGQIHLTGFFWSLCNGLEEETKKEWISRLHPPKPPFGERLDK